MELNFKTLASAYLNVLEGYDFIIPEDVPANERTAFHGAAAAAHKAGKSHFDFGGKKYPVTMKKDVAKAINSDTQKEAKEDELKASTEVDGNDENDTDAKKVPCPKCEGKGCAHCDNKGYHMSKVESSCGSDGKKSRKESVELDELSELKMNDPKLLKVFNKLKPKATVKIKHSSTLEKGKDFIEYIVKSKNTLRNGVEKITLARKDSPTSAKRFLYNRDGKITFAVGDMAASIDAIKEDDSYYTHQVAQHLAKKDGHDYHSLPVFHRGVGQPHQQGYDQKAKDALSRGEYKHGIHDSIKKESVELDESDSYYAMQAAKAHAKRDGKNYDRDVSVQHRYDAYHMKKRGYTHFTPGRYGTRTYHKTDTSGATEIDSSHYHGVREAGPRHTMTPMYKRFGKTVDPKKFDAYKKFVKKNNVDEPTVRMICDNPDAAESKRMMKNKNVAQAVDLYKAAMKKESVEEKKKYLSQKDIKKALASIKPPKKKPTLPKAPWDKKENTLPPAPGGKKAVRSADKRPVNVNVGGKIVTRMEPVTKRTAAAYESVNRENWLDALQNKKLQEAEDAKTKTSTPTGNHKSDDATRDTYDKQLATRKGEKDFVDMHDVETPEYADVNRVLPKTFAAFTAGVKAGGGKTNDAPGDKAMPKNDGK